MLTEDFSLYKTDFEKALFINAAFNFYDHHASVISLVITIIDNISLVVWKILATS